MSTDEKWMRRAFSLARRGMGFVHPNPMVGAVLVRGGKVVGEGFHERYGESHAEGNAIRKAGLRAKGSTLYVTLEPCSHWGKTPPCALTVADAGIKRVVAAMQDPNPIVHGKGFRLLRSRGIRVDAGLLQKEAEQLNRAFIKRITEGRPYVTLKMACSLDGRTSTVTGESKWITSAASRQQGHRLRAIVDAIAVGAGTVLQDNPELTAHGEGRNPIRVVFAGKRKLNKRLKVFSPAAPTMVIRRPRTTNHLKQTLKDLAKQGITHLMVEGGTTLQNSFLAAKLVDEIVCFIAPIVIGQAKRLKDAVRLQGAKDICVRSEVTH